MRKTLNNIIAYAAVAAAGLLFLAFFYGMFLLNTYRWGSCG